MMNSKKRYIRFTKMVSARMRLDLYCVIMACFVIQYEISEKDINNNVMSLYLFITKML